MYIHIYVACILYRTIHKYALQCALTQACGLRDKKTERELMLRCCLHLPHPPKQNHNKCPHAFRHCTSVRERELVRLRTPSEVKRGLPREGCLPPRERENRMRRSFRFPIRPRERRSSTYETGFLHTRSVAALLQCAQCKNHTPLPPTCRRVCFIYIYIYIHRWFG